MKSSPYQVPPARQEIIRNRTFEIKSWLTAVKNRLLSRDGSGIQGSLLPLIPLCYRQPPITGKLLKVQATVPDNPLFYRN